MKKTIAVIVGCATLTACVTTSPPTLADQYPAMYEEQPLSIVIMPPINNTNHAEAKDYFYTSLYHPLCEKGYYVFPPEMTMEMLQHESAYDAELFVDGDLIEFAGREAYCQVSLMGGEEFNNATMVGISVFS